MALRDKLTTSAQPFLEPGEQIQEVVQGTKMSPWWMLLLAIAAFFQQNRLLVVTDRRILVLYSTMFKPYTQKGVLGEAPRDTPLGTPSGLFWKCDAVGPEAVVYVHKRFHKDIRAADVAAAGSGSPA